MTIGMAWMSDQYDKFDQPTKAGIIAINRENIKMGLELGDPNGNENHGVHAMKSMADVHAIYAPKYGAAIYGTVKLWGTVIEHEFGYRAEFAAVNSIDYVGGYLSSQKERILSALRKTYGMEENHG